MPNCLGLENSFGILYDSVGALVQELEKKVYLLHFLGNHGICLLTLYNLYIKRTNYWLHQLKIPQA